MRDTPQSIAARAIVAEFPDAPAMTLAKKLCALHPGTWHSVDAARSSVRYVLGVMGSADGRDVKGPLSRKPRSPQDDWRQYLPDAWTEAVPWGPFEVPGPFDSLILSDLQVPFHDKAAVTAAIHYGRDRGANLILLNGDVVDHYSISRFVTDPKFRDFAGEVRAVRQTLQTIRKAFPDARIILKHGNHEERFENYMRMKAPELLGIPEFTWENAFGVDGMGIEIVKDKRPIMLGSLPVLHGHEISSGGVMPARTIYLRTNDNCLVGHVHRTSQFSRPALMGKLVSTWSVGCLCDLHPEWMRINDWNQGFAFVSVDTAGAFKVDNLRIIDGKAW